MESKKGTYWIPLLMALCVALGLYTGSVLVPKATPAVSMGEARYQKIQDIIQILDQRYVDSVDSKALYEKTIADMLHSLDPHSNYIPAEDLKAMNEAIEGKFGGVGIRFFIVRDTVCFTNVVPDSPSEKAGVKAGDKLLEVDGKKVAGIKITNDEIMGLLKGQEGTDVRLKINRNGTVLEKKVIRGSIPLESISAAYMLTDKIGYVKIDQFSILTDKEFQSAAEKLKKQGMKKIIIDLRNNGGGVLTGATKIADEFLKATTPIVETRGEHMFPYMYRATEKGELEEMEVAVIINSNSASASEILAGAIQDNDRGVIVGRRSFGKGLVQEDFPLRDGSNVRLTTARYYTPTGRCIQRPYSKDFHAYYEDQQGRYENGEMYKVDSTLLVDSLKYTTPKGKIVYGGGGIMPDIFVPYDTSGTSWYYTELRFSAVFNAFAFDFVSDKRNKWKSDEVFQRTFRVTDELLNSFTTYAEKAYSVPFNQRDFKTSKALIARVLKAEIARQLWMEQGFHRVFNSDDIDVQKAIRALQ